MNKKKVTYSVQVPTRSVNLPYQTFLEINEVFEFKAIRWNNLHIENNTPFMNARWRQTSQLSCQSNCLKETHPQSFLGFNIAITEDIFLQKQKCNKAETLNISKQIRNHKLIVKNGRHTNERFLFKQKLTDRLDWWWSDQDFALFRLLRLRSFARFNLSSFFYRKAFYLARDLTQGQLSWRPSTKLSLLRSNKSLWVTVGKYIPS